MAYVTERLQPRGAVALRSRADDMDFIIKIFTVEMVAVVVTQKFAVPIGSAEESQVALALLIHAAVLGILGLRGLLRVSALSLILWCAFAFIAGVGFLVVGSVSYSFMSLLLLLIISTFYLFRIELDREHYLKWLKAFQMIAVGAASLVFLNWALQIVGIGMFDLESRMPHRLVYLHYNYIQPIHWGSPWTKPNAFFFLETSHISQFLAMAIIIELSCFFRIRYLAFLVAALMTTFGGTGMLMVLASLPWILGRVPKGLIVAGLLALPIAYYTANSIGLLDNMKSRSTELNARGTSGEMRFVRPIEAVGQAMAGDEVDLLFGKGAGSMPKGSSIRGAHFAWAPYAKVFVEYGIIAFTLWALLIITAMFGHGIPFAVSWAVFLQYQFMNGSLNVPLHTIYACLLAASIIVTKQREPAQSSWAKAKEREPGAEPKQLPRPSTGMMLRGEKRST